MCVCVFACVCICVCVCVCDAGGVSGLAQVPQREMEDAEEEERRDEAVACPRRRGGVIRRPRLLQWEELINEWRRPEWNTQTASQSSGGDGLGDHSGEGACDDDVGV